MDRMTAGSTPEATQVVSMEDLAKAREVISQIWIDEKVRDYIVDVVSATRWPEKFGLEGIADFIEFGASPRASIYLNMAARAHAFLRRRGFVMPDDIKAIGADVLRHRILLTYEAEAEEISSEDIIRKIFERIDVP
jgi:MoxR-like ATPase